MTTIARNQYFEFAITKHILSLDLSNYHEDDVLHTALLGLSIFWKLPKLLKGDPTEQSYGFSMTTTDLHVHWGDKFNVITYPWNVFKHRRWEQVVGESYAQGRLFWVEVPSAMPHGQLATKYTAPYIYTLRSGVVQERIATYYVERSVWWRKLLPWMRKSEEAIGVQFNGEVGEESGSWKGGTIGCGYSMLPGETAEQTLRRMEREKKF